MTISQNQHHGGKIFCDNGTVFWADNQVSLSAGETLMAYECFKKWHWESAADELSHLWAVLIFETCKNKEHSQ